jgi:NAD(P)-dependent dehydrogenase (short-subunit alcohol dehydrogenase family)
MSLLANHIAVVTGAGSGIGRAIAAGYAREKRAWCCSTSTRTQPRKR